VDKFIKYVGMDVHKETIAVSVAPSGGGEVRYLGEIANTPQAIAMLVKQLRKEGADLKFCYEAASGLHRVNVQTVIVKTVGNQNLLMAT
jgi:transposase